MDISPAKCCHQWFGRRLLAATALLVALLAAIQAAGAGPAVGGLDRLVFTQDYQAGTSDAAGTFMGGTETMRLIGHGGRLFAGLGSWMDEPYLQDKPTGPWTGAQVLVKNGPDVPWRVDVAFGKLYGRTESLAELTFTTDGAGARLAAPVTLLAAGPSDWNPVGQRWAEAWTRDDATDTWAASRIVPVAGSAGVRSVGQHVDAVTGIHHVFAGVSRGEIYRGVYDPAAPGRLRWVTTPELEGTGRVMAFAEANGVLYAAAGVDRPDPDGPVVGGLYQRVDGPSPRWELVYQWPYTPVEDGDEKNLMRGLTAVTAGEPGGGPGGEPHQVLLATRANPGVVERIDPAAGHKVTVELDIKAYFARAWGRATYRGPALSAYNDILPVTDPVTGAAAHLIGVWVEHPDNGRPPYNGSWYLVRHADGSYTHGHVHDPAQPVPAGQRLRATRTIAVSPFSADGGAAFYMGGYDCAKVESHNTAWIYRGVVGDPAQASPTAPGPTTPRPTPRPSATRWPTATAGASPTPRPAPAGAPNIVFVLTDDQDLHMDSLAVMPRLKAFVADQGTALGDFYLSYPLCCPSRSTILRGQYVHSHQVYSNLPPVGGYEKWLPLGLESSTVGTWLQQGGYRTVYIGKYLNGYPLPVDPLHVPDGWTEWYSPAGGNPYGSYNYVMNENGQAVPHGSAPEDHVTDVIAGHAEAAIRRAVDDPRPFFLHVAPYAPHAPADPAPRHAALFPDAQVPRVPSFNEADVSDKPRRIQALAPLTAREISALDADYRKRLRSLQAVDEMIERLVTVLAETGELENTYFVFTSDNGFHMGHHRLPAGKSTAYEEDIHVPFIVRGPGVPAGRTVGGYLAGNVDLAPTVADWAGVTPPGYVEGRSLAPLFGPDLPDPAAWRQVFLVEGYGGGSRDNRGTPAPTPAAWVRWPAAIPGTIGIWEPPDPFDLSVDAPAAGLGPAQDEEEGPQRELYVALRSGRYTYVESRQGPEWELYDNAADPYQLENLVRQVPVAWLDAFSERANALHACAGAECRHLEALPLELPAVTPGTPTPPTATTDPGTAVTPPATVTATPVPMTGHRTLHLPLVGRDWRLADFGPRPTAGPATATTAPTAIPGTINGCAPAALDRCGYRPVTWVDVSAVRALQGYTVTNTAEGRELPIVVRAATGVSGARPVVVWSHGGGARDEASLTMNREWATALARAGFIVVQPAHISPDVPALCAKLGVTDPAECGALQWMTWYRPTDARAVLDALPALVAAFPQLAGRVDLGRVAYAGHSFGAFTSMTVMFSVVHFMSALPQVCCGWLSPLAWPRLAPPRLPTPPPNATSAAPCPARSARGS